MSDNNQKFLKKDLVYILQLNSQIQYDNKHNVQQAHDMALRKQLFKSVLGQKYVKRLEQVINGTDVSGKCTLCKNNLDNPSLVCNSCLAKYKLTPASKEAVENNALTETSTSTENNALAETSTPTENDSSTENFAQTESAPTEAGKPSTNLKLRDLFSGILQKHTHEESEEIFLTRTRQTALGESDTANPCPKPWLFLRVLTVLLATFILLYICVVRLQESTAIPGMMLMGALALPFSVLIFMLEMNAPRNIGIFEVMKMFFLGAIAALILTLFLYKEFPIGQLNYTEAVIVALIEALGKLLILILFVRRLNPKYILNGLLIGAAVGAGFAVFETIGYAFRFYLLSGGNINYLADIMLLRTWSSLGSHVAWTAITGAGLIMAKSDKPLYSKPFTGTSFLQYFSIPIILHAIWDCPFMDSGSNVYIKLIALTVIAWLIIFRQLNMGLKQTE